MRYKAIVTGGAGFIGSHLVDRLVSQDFEVMVIDNLSTGLQENLNKEAKFLNKDLRDNDIEAIIKSYSPEYIFHLAAQIDVRKSLKDPIWDENINIEGTLNLLNAASNAKVKKLIFSSTGGAIYGEARNAKEDRLPCPLSPYGVAKLSCEHYLRVYSQWKDLSFTVLRYGNVYGPRQDPFGEAGVIAIFSRQLILGQKPVLYGYGRMIRDYVYVADVVEANIRALERGTGEIYNIGAGKATSVNDIFGLLRNISGNNIEPELKKAREGETLKVWLNSQKAFHELGWKPEVSLEDGLKRTYNWFKEHSSYGAK